MSEVRLKQRATRSADEVLADVEVAAGRTPTKAAAPKVIKLGAKERLNSYLTPEQKRKVRLLAIQRDSDISEVVGWLIDQAETPTF